MKHDCEEAYDTAFLATMPFEVQPLPGDDFQGLSRGDFGLSRVGEDLRLGSTGDAGDPVDLTPEQIERVRDHIKQGHIRKEPLCKECVGRRGSQETAKAWNPNGHAWHISMFAGHDLWSGKGIDTS